MTKKPKDNAYYRRRYWYFRREAMKKYGNKCVRCGFSDERALQFNHINGDGFLNRRQKYFRTRTGLKTKYDPREFLRILVQEPVRDDIELLCSNCNWIFEYERGFRKGPPPDLGTFEYHAHKKRMESKPPIEA